MTEMKFLRVRTEKEVVHKLHAPLPQQIKILKNPLTNKKTYVIIDLSKERKKKMKKFCIRNLWFTYLMVFVLTSFFWMIFNPFFLDMAIKEKYYATVGVVTEISANHSVAVKDYNNNIWIFKSSNKDWTEKDVCAMIMDNNGTLENIEDDKIVSATYCGYLPIWNKN